MMTPDDYLLEKMKAIVAKYGADCEAIHNELDDLLVRKLSSLGFRKSMKYFEEVEKWYA